MDGPTGLVYSELERVARWRFKWLRIEWVFDLVQLLEHEWIAFVQRKQKAAAEAAKTKRGG